MKTTEPDTIDTDVLCPEEYFQKMLIRVREKTEKSKSNFMLVLVDVGELFNYVWGGDGAVQQKTTQALYAATREKDIKGWYLHNSLIGIICPGFSHVDKNNVLENIRRKLERFSIPGKHQQ